MHHTNNYKDIKEYTCSLMLGPPRSFFDKNEKKSTLPGKTQSKRESRIVGRLARLTFDLPVGPDNGQILIGFGRLDRRTICRWLSEIIKGTRKHKRLCLETWKVIVTVFFFHFFLINEFISFQLGIKQVTRVQYPYMNLFKTNRTRCVKQNKQLYRTQAERICGKYTANQRIPQN